MTDLVITLSIVFVTAGILLLIGNRLNIPVVPLYIIAGVLAGQFIADETLIDLALWGIAFLVFVFGIRVNLDDLRLVLQDGEGAAATRIAVVAPIALTVGYGLGGLFGVEAQLRNAIYFGAAATLCSTLVGGHVRPEETQQEITYGRLASAVHFFDDVVAIGVVLVLSAETLTDAQLVTSNLGFGVIFVLAGLFIYRHGFPLLLRAADGDEELVLMGSISLLIGFVAAAELAGVSIVVGAFAAGLAVRKEGSDTLGVRNGIRSITDFFAAIFFVTVGALVAVPTVEVLVLAGVLIVLVAALNPLIHTFAFIFEGYDGRTAFLAGFSLNQVSEFALVIAIQAWLLGTIADTVFDGIILAAAVTMIFAAFTNQYKNRIYDVLFAPLLGNRTGYIDRHSDVTDGITDHIVVLGYGSHGRQIVEELKSLGCQCVVVENDPARREDLQISCENYVFGDVMADYPMEVAELSDARLVVSTIDHQPVSESLLDRDFTGDLILKSDSSREASSFLDAGATFVAVADVLASDQLVETIERAVDTETERDSLEGNHPGTDALSDD